MFRELELQNKNLLKNEVEDMHTILIGKLYDVDNSKRKASVKFLQKTVRTLKNDVIQTIPSDLTDVPLLPIFSSPSCEIYVPYSNGDKVIVGVLERPYIEAFYNDEVQEQQSFGRMDIGYSVVMKSIPRNILSEDQTNPESIFIKNNTTNIIIKKGSIEINGDCNWNGDLKINGDLTVNGKIKATEIDTTSGVAKGGTPYIHP